MTNNYPNIGKIQHGRDHNFYQKIIVTATDFGNTTISGEQPDIVITFPTHSIMLLNEDTTNIIEYSFNGNTVHGELNPTLPTRGLVFDNRTVSLMWFRIKSGSSGPVTVRIDAW